VESLWYVFDGTAPQGPFGEAELRAWLAAGALAPGTPVAPAGGSDWLPVERAFPDALPSPAAAALSSAPASAPAGSASPASAPHPAPAPQPAPVVASALVLPLRCLSGPDAGKAFWIGPATVALGAAAGLSGAGELHAQLVDSSVRLAVASGPPLELESPGAAGRAETGAALAAGERFRWGGALWQVGDRSVRLGELAEKLGERLNRLASVEKLEGFRLSEFFSEVFTRRTPDQLDAHFLVGTAQTTPPLEEVETGWPQPWLFVRVLGFLGVVYLGFYFAVRQFENPRLLPGLVMMGSLAVPFSVLVLFFELNTPRNVSFRQLLSLFFLGGVASLGVSLVGFSLADLSWLGASSAGIVEEVGKLLAVVLVARGARHRFVLNGLLFGAAVGAGFAAFESAGYAFFDALLATGSIGETTNLILRRAVLSPFAHVAWTAIAAGALWRVKGARRFSPAMFLDGSFLGAFSIPVVLHMIWNSPLPSPFYLKHLACGFVSWFVLFGLVQQGLRQVKSEQREATRFQLEGTRSLTGALRIPPAALAGPGAAGRAAEKPAAGA
jgi:RsiW-degrading membrane proteinase PrsW (M82 family)